MKKSKWTLAQWHESLSRNFAPGSCQAHGRADLSAPQTPEGRLIKLVVIPNRTTIELAEPAASYGPAACFSGATYAGEQPTMVGERSVQLHAPSVLYEYDFDLLGGAEDGRRYFRAQVYLCK